MKRKLYDYDDDLDDLPVGCVKAHFLDSGSFTFWTKAEEYAVANKCKASKYYETKEFRTLITTHMDDYAIFIGKHQVGIDLYANVDVIPIPELTWKNQQYLEDVHGLTPVPVVHYTTDLKWLDHYIDRGYEIIGIGGLVGSTAMDGCRIWLDRVFDRVCRGSSRLPKVKLHGFGVTVYDLLLRYPWYSVDSTTWTKIAAYGGILVPHLRRGKFVFDEQPYIIKMSMESPTRVNRLQHYLTSPAAEQRVIRQWLDHIGVSLGEVDKYGDVVKWGVITRHTERRVANLLFFEHMLASLPQYPWPFTSTRGEGFGL